MNNISLDPKFAWIARLGYAARGTLYLMIGGLAILAAFGSGGKTTGSKGALTTLRDEPYGMVMIAIMALGLICYSLWRAVQSLKDTDDHGVDAKGLAIRSGLLVSSITHVVLAVWAARIIFGDGSSSGSSSTNSAEGLLGHTWAQILFGVVGLCVIGAGIAHLIKGWNSGFQKYMSIPTRHEKWAVPLCKFGLISRGFVYCIIGSFLASSVWVAGTGDVKSLSGALSWLKEQPFGVWLLGITAIGLFSFGIYSCLEAMYRRISS